MAEINIVNVIPFSKGFIIESGQSLAVGTTYYINIVDSSSNIINKTYTPSVVSTIIISSWGTTIPIDGSVCLSLSDIATGNILCTTVPSGASVSIDDISQGVITPIIITNITTGNHKVTFTLSNYVSCDVQVNVTYGNTTSASCTLIENVGSISGNVKDTSGINIVGATVSDGTRSATTDSSGNYTITNVPVGIYSVVASYTGYTSNTLSNISVTAGMTTSGVSFTLTLITGSIVCTTIPSGAAIAIDGIDTGYTTPTTFNVTPGNYTITYTLTSYDTYSVQLSVIPGVESFVSYTLIPSMIEISINNTFQFGAGFIVESSQTLTTGTSYILDITDSLNNTITKIYNPVINGKSIIDIWGTTTPTNGTVCFTLKTSPTTLCSQLTCAVMVT